MKQPRSPDIERQALALFEALADLPDGLTRIGMLATAPSAVRERVEAMERGAALACDGLPTLIPGSAELGDAAVPPSPIGQFRLVERIGRGGMGDVWLGLRDDGLYEQKVAIKLIQRHALDRARGAFDDERRFLARLEHPNIARLIDGGVTEDGLPWLAMEFVEGQPIDVACAGMPLARRTRIFVKAADAVQYAHGRMVAHGDLKPGNIAVTRDGRVKLLDFGVASLIDDDRARPAEARPLTQAFASPERIAGGSPSVADDVFALGRTLALLIGDAREAELAAIAAKAAAANERDRYGSVAALIGDLDRWAQGLTVQAMPDGWLYRTRKFLGRHRLGAVATTLALGALAAAALVATINYVRAERERGVAEQRFGAVRTLSGLMLFDLYDELARQPGTVEKRAEIARTAALYLDRLAIGREAPADLRRDTARSYRRLAAIQGLSGTSNLGRPGAAARSLDRAEAILTTLVAADPRDVAALRELGWVASDRWTLLSDGKDPDRTNARARHYFDRVLALRPDDADALLGLLTTEKDRAYERIWVADAPADAVPILHRALARLRATTWPTALGDRPALLEIGLLNRLGDALYYTGDIAGSLAPFRAADGRLDGLVAKEGRTPLLLTMKGGSAFNISGSLGDMKGHDPEALAVARAAAPPLERILRAGPDAAAEKTLLILYGQQAAVLESMKRYREALAPAEAGIALRRQRLAASPHDPRRMRDWAIGQSPYARLLKQAGRGAQACAVARAGVSGWEAIRASGQLSSFDRTKSLPKAMALQGDYCPGR